MSKLFKNFEVIKHPIGENDSIFIRLEFDEDGGFFELNNYVPEFLIWKFDLYTQTKMKMFINKSTDPKILEPYSLQRPSLRDINKKTILNGTVYTKCIPERNGYSNEKEMFNDINNRLYNSYADRRIILIALNKFDEYYKSASDETMDVTCLAFIHYLKNQVNLAFRASDIKNELLTDIVTITNSFILPVYQKLVPIEIFASTAQNVDIKNIEFIARY